MIELILTIIGDNKEQTIETVMKKHESDIVDSYISPSKRRTTFLTINEDSYSVIRSLKKEPNIKVEVDNLATQV